MKDNFYPKYKNLIQNNIQKYLQLKDSLLAAIEDGFWRPGEKLPAETEIARTTPFSLGTVQKALRMLADQRIVERRQGHGTFVIEKMVVPWHCRFITDGEDNFLPTFPKVIARNIIQSNAPWANHIAPKGEEIIQIDRLINIGHQFDVYNKFYISRTRFGKFWEKPVEEIDVANLKRILNREYNLPVTHTSSYLKMVNFLPEVCQALNLKSGYCGMLLEIMASSGTRNPVYYYEVYIPKNDYKLYISDFSYNPEYWL
jgi:DNA-binding GntR family transcriptional regulator